MILQLNFLIALCIFTLFLPSLNFYAIAQEEGTTIGKLIGGKNANTFSAKGLISSLEGNTTLSRYILAGYWQLQVKNGQVKDFSANFSQLRPDGTVYHGHEFSNFIQKKNTSILLNLTGNTAIHGRVDVGANGTLLDRNVRTDITLSNATALLIILAGATEFPIYGVVTSLETPNASFSCLKVHTC